MTEIGVHNPANGVAELGLGKASRVFYNLNESELYEEAIRNGEAELTIDGALRAVTGQHTGRSPKDKFVVRDASTENTIWWDNNKPLSPENFELLRQDMLAHAAGKTLYVQDLIGGADEENALPTRVVTELAWHSLFIRNLLIRPKQEKLAGFKQKLTIINLPSFKADPARHGVRSETVIACDLTNGLVLIGGTSYAGENKKSVFTVLNYLLPAKGVMPMHCSANVGPQGDSAVFFGLSGTGKTTLSADQSRTLIGDDEPEIYAATRRFGTVLENVVLDENRVPDFNDNSLTENTRSAYPLHFIPNASETGIAGHPKTIIMLTADAFGVLPPIARLTPEQAMYHFLSGYTAKVAGTEKGVTEPEATFSTCFGAPFMPRHPAEYGNLLRELIGKHGVDCWLVNTGWTGGAYGIGKRMPIKATRALLTAALTGDLKNAQFRTDANFGFAVPQSLEGVDSAILDPRSTWSEGAAHDAPAKTLVSMFVTNFTKFEDHVDSKVRDAAPGLLLAAE